MPTVRIMCHRRLTHQVVEDLCLLDDPEAGQLLEALERVEGDEVVDVHVGDPQLPQEVDVDRQP